MLRIPHRIKKNQRVPLVTKEGKPVQTVAQAVAELNRLQTQRSDNTLPTLHERRSLTNTRRAIWILSQWSGNQKASTVAKEKRS